MRKHLRIDVNVLIRPRGGDFCYSENEFLIMKRDIEICKALKINGVVFGILNPDGTIDIERNRELVELAHPMNVTFHRAFDMVRNPFDSLSELINLGVDRILTSGLKQTAILGAELISELVSQADNKLIIMPGSGVKPENIEYLMQKTNAREFHLSGIKKIPSRMLYQNPEIAMGGVAGVPEYEISVTDSEIIRKVVQIANDFKYLINK